MKTYRIAYQYTLSGGSCAGVEWVEAASESLALVHFGGILMADYRYKLDGLTKVEVEEDMPAGAE